MTRSLFFDPPGLPTPDQLPPLTTQHRLIDPVNTVRGGQVFWGDAEEAGDDTELQGRASLIPVDRFEAGGLIDPGPAGEGGEYVDLVEEDDLP